MNYLFYLAKFESAWAFVRIVIFLALLSSKIFHTTNAVFELQFNIRQSKTFEEISQVE